MFHVTEIKMNFDSAAGLTLHLTNITVLCHCFERVCNRRGVVNTWCFLEAAIKLMVFFAGGIPTGGLQL